MSKISISFVVLLAFFLSSCSSMFYKHNRPLNQTVFIKSNNKEFDLFLPKSTNSKVSIQESDGNQMSYYVPKLRKKYMQIELSSQNCEPISLKLRKIPRVTPIVLDLLLSPFSYGLPLIIDPFKSDFYKLKEESKNFNVTFEFKQDFMSAEFSKLKTNQNPKAFLDFINKYPNYSKLSEVRNLKNELEFNNAVNASSEFAILEFVNSHPDFDRLNLAKKIYEDFKSARLAFGDAEKSGLSQEIEIFLEKFPNSVHDRDAHILLINSKELETIKSDNIATYISYFNDYLEKHRNFLTEDEYKNKKSRIIENIKKSIRTDVKRNSGIEQLSKLWETYSNTGKDLLDKNSINIIEGSFRENFSKPIYLYLFSDSSNNDIDQFNLLNNAFLNLYKKESYVRELFGAIENKNGKVILKNYNFYEPSNSLNELNDFPHEYTYLDEKYPTFKTSNLVVMNFVQNKLDGVQEVFNGKDFGNDKVYIVNYINGDKFGESFYKSGQLVKSNVFTNDNKLLYFTEYKNSINLTLQNFKNEIKRADLLYAEKDYNNALAIYKAVFDTPRTKDEKMDSELRSKIEKSEMYIAQENRKSEALRIKEEQRAEKHIVKEKVSEVNRDVIQEYFQTPTTIFYQDVDVLVYLNNTISFKNVEDNLTLTFSDMSRVTTSRGKGYFNPEVTLISKTRALVRYQSLNNPDGVVNIIVDSKENAVVDRSNMQIFKAINY